MFYASAYIFFIYQVDQDYTNIHFQSNPNKKLSSAKTIGSNLTSSHPCLDSNSCIVLLGSPLVYDTPL